jgi:16S rRNA G527 N7-methylase RsmG
VSVADIAYAPLSAHLTAPVLANLQTFADLLEAEAMPAGFIGECTRADLELRHIFDSVLPAIAPETRERFPLNAGEGLNVFDLGAGSGLPSLPLAILYPQHKFHLLDAQEKRCRFAESAAAKLGLSNVTVYHGVVQDFPEKYAAAPKADVVVFRAFRKILASLELALHVLSAAPKDRQRPGSAKSDGPRSLPASFQKTPQQTSAKAPEAGCPPNFAGPLRSEAIALQSPKLLYWRSQRVPFSAAGEQRVTDLGYKTESFVKFESAASVLPRGLYTFAHETAAKKPYPRSWKKISADTLVDTES